MALPKSPFAPSASLPGIGNIELSLLAPGQQVLTSFTFQYPLKLIAPDPHVSSYEKPVTVVFLLTYGGGLVGGDKINLTVELKDETRLVLVTQGSTKLFKCANRSVVSRQILNVKVGSGAALCYLADPTQPFAESVYEQRQTFYLSPDGTSSLLMLDWVSEGRRARGESWTLWSWSGRNEIREFDPQSRGRLLLRDSIMLHEDGLGGVGLAEKTNDLGIFGTLVIHGSVFKSLGEHFLQQFSSQPRIGSKNWTKDEDADEQVTEIEKQAQLRREDERSSGLLWTAANVRGFVLVKFGAKEIDGAKRWLGGMLHREGTVEAQFGQQALIGLR